MLTEATGDITPPRDTQVDHTVAYKDEVHCEWRIQLPVNERIVLNFVTFNLETCSECGCDYVEVSSTVYLLKLILAEILYKYYLF